MNFVLNKKKRANIKDNSSLSLTFNTAASFLLQSHAPERMYSYHAGPITGLDTSPVAHFVATTGVDRK